MSGTGFFEVILSFQIEGIIFLKKEAAPGLFKTP